MNKDEYIIYYAYTSVQSVITYDKLVCCFRSVYVYACIAVFFCVGTDSGRMKISILKAAVYCPSPVARAPPGPPVASSACCSPAPGPWPGLTSTCIAPPPAARYYSSSCCCCCSIIRELSAGLFVFVVFCRR